jgi:D-glycero-D-manno-heptose 1,7-bisphosphate phosphatase
MRPSAASRRIKHESVHPRNRENPDQHARRALLTPDLMTPSFPGSFDEALGIWVRVPPQAVATSRPALFLDRDGVIVEDPGYLACPSGLKLIPGAAGLIALANGHGIPVVEVTNQAGIGRGYYGWHEFTGVEAALADALAREGAAIDAVFACPYHREGVHPWAHPDHPARKPRPGMLLAAGRLLNLDLKRSWIVGDRLDDLLAGYHAGLRGGLHVLTGIGASERAAVVEWTPENFDLRLGNSIADAEALIMLP